MATVRILVAEDNRSWQGIIQRKIHQICDTQTRRLDIVIAESYEHASELLDAEEAWTLFITDLGFSNSPSADGKKLLEVASKRGIPAIVVTGAPTPHLMGVKNSFSKANFDAEKFGALLKVLVNQKSQEQPAMRILAADVGGTKVLLGIADVRDGQPVITAERRYASKDFPGLLEIIQKFLADTGYTGKQFNSACFGIAGPIDGDESVQTCQLTNLLDWDIINSQALSTALSIPKVRLINDLQAIGYGIDALDAKDIITLQEGKPVSNGTRAIMAVGTGLGQAIMVWTGKSYTVLATEGGHVDFAPLDEQQFRLMQYIKRTLKLERVSYERLLSGDGLVAIYQFLCSKSPTARSDDIQKEMQHKDPASVITQFAVQDKDTLALAAIDIFVRIYGAQTGNLALSCLPRGGIYLSGGITEKLSHILSNKSFAKMMCAKGRMDQLLLKIPLHVVSYNNIGLHGCIRKSLEQ